jgi:hypothetical protein
LTDEKHFCVSPVDPATWDLYQDRRFCGAPASRHCAGRIDAFDHEYDVVDREHRGLVVGIGQCGLHDEQGSWQCEFEPWVSADPKNGVKENILRNWEKYNDHLRKLLAGIKEDN